MEKINNHIFLYIKILMQMMLVKTRVIDYVDRIALKTNLVVAAIIIFLIDGLKITTIAMVMR